MSHDHQLRYGRRFAALLEYIDLHLDAELTLDLLSAEAACSKFHFLRQFSALYGISVADYVLLMRLRRAAHQLAFRREQSVLDVALAAGFESAEAFARAFKRYSRQTPSAFRKAPQWSDWQDKFHLIQQLKRQQTMSKHQLSDVQIVNIPATAIAVLEHRGRPELLPHSIQQFIAWRKAMQLPPSKYATYNLVYDDPNAVAAEAYRFDLAVAVKAPVADNSAAIINKMIPAGRCARLRHIGSDLGLEHSVRFLFEQWLPDSGENLRDFPLFFHRVSFYPEVAETQMITDIHLPLQ